MGFHGMMMDSHCLARIIMQTFLQRHQAEILGVLSGFDRVRFKGTLRSLSYLNGFDAFLAAHHGLYKDFGKFVERVSDRIKEHARAFAERQGRPLVYLASSRESTEDVASRIAERDGVQQGLVCVLSCVEPCPRTASAETAKRSI